MKPVPEVEMVEISKLKFYDRNPNQGDIGAISESIKNNDWYGVVTVNKRADARSFMTVLAGNHRVKAAATLGITELPVYWVDKNDAEAAAILVADNRASALSFNDTEVLTDLLQELVEADLLSHTLYDADDLDAMLAQLMSDDQGNVGPDSNTPIDDLEKYKNSGVRAIMLPMTKTEFDEMTTKLDLLRSEYGMETNTQVVQKLVNDAL